MAQCRRCGAFLRDGVHYCSNCGEPVMQGQPAGAHLRADAASTYAVNPSLPFLPASRSVGRTRNATSIILGALLVALGSVLVFIGLNADLSCGLISALGGQCVTVFGSLVVQGPLHLIPWVLVGWGILSILAGLIAAARPALA